MSQKLSWFLCLSWAIRISIDFWSVYLVLIARVQHWISSILVCCPKFIFIYQKWCWYAFSQIVQYIDDDQVGIPHWVTIISVYLVLTILASAFRVEIKKRVVLRLIHITLDFLPKVMKWHRADFFSHVYQKTYHNQLESACCCIQGIKSDLKSAVVRWDFIVTER